MFLVTVHTTGVNVDGVLANAVAIIIIVGFFTGIIVKLIKRSIGEAVRTVIEAEVTPILNQIRDELKQHDTRLARLEGVEEGKRYALDAAGVTTAPLAAVARGAKRKGDI